MIAHPASDAGGCVCGPKVQKNYKIEPVFDGPQRA